MSTLTAKFTDSLHIGTVTEAENRDSALAPELLLGFLKRILSSPGFTATERSHKLLQYLVTETLEGRGSRLKAYSIATEVLGRPSSFDPQSDPIVRIEAARLRRELEHYYLTEGREDLVVIDIPKGTYVPRFVLKEKLHKAGIAGKSIQGNTNLANARSATLLALSALAILSLALLGMLWWGLHTAERNGSAAVQARAPVIMVKPLTDLTQSNTTTVIAKGLSERIIERISRFKELGVVAWDGQSPLPSAAEVRYELSGTLRDQNGRILVQARLVDRTDGRVIWADSLDTDLQSQELFDVESKVADRIATRIAETNGIVFEVERRRLTGVPPLDWNAYFCTLGAQAYQADYSAAQYANVRSCLEKAVVQDPGNATAWALLSLTYIDELRFSYAPEPGNKVPALTRAYDAARRAVELDPSNVRGQHALMMTLFFRKDYEQAIEVGQNARLLNPNDLELKGELGFRLALFGRWEEGCRLMEEALDVSMKKLAYYKVGLALCSYFENDFAAAATQISNADVGEDNPNYHIIAAAIFAEAGKTQLAMEHKRWLERNVSQQLPKLLSEVPKRLVQEKDQQRIFESLKKAGL